MPPNRRDPTGSVSPPANGVNGAMAVVVIAIAALVGWHNTFSVPFIMDDLPSIVDNPTIRHLGSAWSPPRDSGVTVSGRPLLNFSLALNHAVSGNEVWSYHAFNLLIHAFAGGLLFAVTRWTLRRPGLPVGIGAAAHPIALWVAVLWTLHPLQTESVTYVIQRAESLSGLFYLLTFFCFQRSIQSARRGWWESATVASCLAGIATKEVVATAPVLLLLYDRIFLAASWREVWRLRAKLHGALLATWLLLAWLVLASAGRGGTVGFDSPISPGTYALTQTYAIATYLRLALWPVGLVFDYGVPQATGLSEIAPEFIAFLGLVLLAAVTIVRAPRAGFCALFFFGTLAPTSSLVPVVTQTMTEHRMYLPLAGVVALFVSVGYRALGTRAGWLFLPAAVALAVLTIQRNELYQSDLALWNDTAAKRPDNLRAHLNIGMIHYREGRFAEAATAYREVLRLDPNMIEAANNLGNSLLKLGRIEEALAHLDRALVGLEGKERAVALNNLANAQLQAGRGTDALARLHEAVRLHPDLTDARFNLANTLTQAGRPAEALPHYEAALQGKPGDHEILGNYANALLDSGRTAEAISRLRDVVSLRPDLAESWNNLGVALAMEGRPNEAREQFARALSIDPGFAEARANLARVERELGRGP